VTTTKTRKDPMKRIALTVALLGCAGATYAQKTDVPPPNCGAKPEYPGRLVLSSDMRRRSFDREVTKYADCMKAYVEERKAVANANMTAGNAAIEEYNTAIKKLKEDEEAAKRE